MNTTETTARNSLVDAYKVAELHRRVTEELFPSEMGADLIPSSLIIALDGESFTVRALNGFSIRSTAEGVGTIMVDRGQRLKFNKYLEAVRER